MQSLMLRRRIGGVGTSHIHTKTTNVFDQDAAEDKKEVLAAPEGEVFS